MNDMFRTVALALRPYVTGTYDLLNATDAVLDVMNSQPSIPKPDDHEGMVAFCLRSPFVLIPLAQGKKISAIKALRTETHCSLVEAKNAVEDDRVLAFYCRPD